MYWWEVLVKLHNYVTYINPTLNDYIDEIDWIPSMSKSIESIDWREIVGTPSTGKQRKI